MVIVPLEPKAGAEYSALRHKVGRSKLASKRNPFNIDYPCVISLSWNPTEKHVSRQTSSVNFLDIYTISTNLVNTQQHRQGSH